MTERIPVTQSNYVALAATGDCEAAAVAVEPDLRAIFIAESGYVWSVLRRLGVRESELEDFVHDVFVAVHRALASYDRARPLRPWLFGIAFRVASDHRRRAWVRREESHASPPEFADATDPVDERISAEQDRALVLRAVDALSDDRRAILLMHDFDEIGVPEIAHALGIPLNTAYSRLRAARQAFVKEVRRLQENPSERSDV